MSNLMSNPQNTSFLRTWAVCTVFLGITGYTWQWRQRKIRKTKKSSSSRLPKTAGSEHTHTDALCGMHSVCSFALFCVTVCSYALLCLIHMSVCMYVRVYVCMCPSLTHIIISIDRSPSIHASPHMFLFTCTYRRHTHTHRRRKSLQNINTIWTSLAACFRATQWAS
jgi:hypothetical protein